VGTSVLLGNVQELQPDLADSRMEEADLPGDSVGHVDLAALLVGPPVIDTDQLKLAGAGVDQADDGPKGKVGVGGGQRFAVEALGIGCLAAVELSAVPAGVAYPGLDWLNWLALIGRKGCFHHRGDKEHEGYPANGCPDHEEWSSHSVVFLLQLP